MASAAHPVPGLLSDQEWKDVLADIMPGQGEWSEEEYLVLTDHRVRLVEYTDGFLEVLPRPTVAHQTLLKLLFLAFFNFPVICRRSAILQRAAASLVAGILEVTVSTAALFQALPPTKKLWPATRFIACIAHRPMQLANWTRGVQ